MTRKHFEAIAADVRDARNVISETAAERAVVDALARNLASTLAGMTPRFDRDRFLAACADTR